MPGRGHTVRSLASLSWSCEAGCRAGSSFGGLGLAIATGRGGFQGMEQARRGAGDVVNGGVERSFVGFRRVMEAGDFPHELQGSRANLLRRDRRIEIEKCSDVAAHRRPPGIGSSEYKRPRRGIDAKYFVR